MQPPHHTCHGGRLKRGHRHSNRDRSSSRRLTTCVTAAVSREATGTATATGARRGASLAHFPLLPAALAVSTRVAEVQEGAGGREQVEKTVHNAYTQPIKPCVPAPPVVSSHGSIFCGATAGAGAAARTPADDRVGCINFLKRRGVIKGHVTVHSSSMRCCAGCENSIAGDIGCRSSVCVSFHC